MPKVDKALPRVTRPPIPSINRPSSDDRREAIVSRRLGAFQAAMPGVNASLIRPLAEQGWNLVTTPAADLAGMGLGPGVIPGTSGNTDFRTRTIYAATGGGAFDVPGIVGHELGHVAAAQNNLIARGFANYQATGRRTGALGGMAIARVRSLFDERARNAPLGPEMYYIERAANAYSAPFLTGVQKAHIISYFSVSRGGR